MEEPGPNESAATLLVVDDHEGGLYLKSRTLARAGFRVIEATDGQAALRIVREQQPALVVLDVKLPDVDGIAVCREIKDDPATASTMVLQVSAYYTSTDDHVQGLDSGADAYLPGDIAPALLLATVRALLRTSRAEQAIRDREERLRLREAVNEQQEKLRELTAMLLTTQEQERRRIARELHDDLCQRVARLEMDLAKLRDNPAGGQLEPIIGQTRAIFDELRSLSHSLHPSVLEHLGLKAALQSLVEDFEYRHNIAVHFLCLIDRGIPFSIATVLYRIAQEALRNVAKHAGDARVTLTLSENAHELCLTIRDDGCGFDGGIPRTKPGLGLISMQERASLIGGHLEVHSIPGGGTTVGVRVRLPDDEGLDATLTGKPDSSKV